MTRLPRDVSGDVLANALRALGYQRSRQDGSHIRLTTDERGEHHVTIPRHKTLKPGTLSAILADVQEHFELSRDELLMRLFG